MIANFFQSLLTRDKASKSSYGGRRGKDVRKAAEKALKKMRRKSLEKDRPVMVPLFTYVYTYIVLFILFLHDKCITCKI